MNYYISPIGKNTNPGTEASPWLTIQNAVSKVAPGDTVFIRGGTYNEQVLCYYEGGGRGGIDVRTGKAESL